MTNTKNNDACKPDKNVLVPPYVYSTEGFDPAECDKLNAAAQVKYETEKARRAIAKETPAP